MSKNNLRSLRKALGYSLQELAVKAKMAPSTLVMIELYGHEPRPAVRQKLVLALGVNEEQIFPSDGRQ